MLKYFFVIIFILANLQASMLLNKNYYTNSKNVKISDINPSAKNDKILYTFVEGKHTKRVKSSQLLKLLKLNGVKDFTSKHTYVRFIQKSPIDTSKIEVFIKEQYKKRYKDIKVQSITVHPRGYIQVLAKEYTIKMQSKSYLRRNGIVAIKSFDGKDTFFDYNINAKVSVYRARKNIKRNSELSALNTRKKSIVLEKFKAMPVGEIKKSTLQSKYRIKKGTILTTRDISPLYLIKRGSSVNVSLDSSNLSISFSAKAVQNGCLGDIISVVQSNGKKIKVRVTAHHSAEVR
ncbi:MAG: flagellar basal body P-ring formation chaperone FlgA [Sulfurimonas sp.]